MLCFSLASFWMKKVFFDFVFLLFFVFLACYTQILRILANIAHKKKEFCVQLMQLGLLSALCATLKMADQEMVIQSLDILFMMTVSSPVVSVVISETKLCNDC